MSTLRVTSLLDGMVLAAAALDQGGAVVVPSGTVITRAVYNRLIAGRVRKVEVVDRPAPATARLPRPAETEAPRTLRETGTVVMEDRLLRLAHMFNDYREDEIMRELCRLAVKCAQERLIRV